MNSPAINAVVIYIIIMLIIITIKPAFLYDHNRGQFREFGSKPGQTYLSLIVFGILLSVILFYFSITMTGKGLRRMRYLPRYT